MDPGLLTTIVVGSFGTLILLLWGWIQKQSTGAKAEAEARRIEEKANFEARRLEEKVAQEKMRIEDRDAMKDTLKQIQSSIERQTQTHKELSDAINKVSNMFEKLNLTLQMVEKDSSNRFAELDKRIDMVGEHLESIRKREIAALWGRDHDLFAMLQVIRLQAEKHEWEFKSDWDMTQIKPQSED